MPQAEGGPLINAGLIDARALVSKLSLEELREAAENYFARLESWDYHLAKPFGAPHEAPIPLQHYTQVLAGLGLVPGMRVLDFGAGSCWNARFLTQLGMEVIALDVSVTALAMGRALYYALPPIGARPKPTFLLFDGRTIDLPAERVDRIVCLDAFHHVPNPEQVLAEMARVLRPGGLAGFAEPGPDHSRSAQSQHEMRILGVIERDIVISEIWQLARRVGFADTKPAIFGPPGFHVGIEEFGAFPSGADSGTAFLRATRGHLRERRIFLLRKAGEAPVWDGRQFAGLLGDLLVMLHTTPLREGEPFRAQAMITNTGTAVWLPDSAPVGPVRFACCLLDAREQLLNRDYYRCALTTHPERPISPGDIVHLQAQVPSPSRGRYVLEFGLAADGVCWFDGLGSPTVRMAVEVH